MLAVAVGAAPKTNQVKSHSVERLFSIWDGYLGFILDGAGNHNKCKFFIHSFQMLQSYTVIWVELYRSINFVH